MKFTLDLHTHTVASGHAYSTVQEMAKAAADKGLKLLGITEHAQGIPGTCDEIYFHNIRIIPRKMYGIDLMFGSEINIIDHDGTLSMEEEIIEKTLDIRIAGIHLPCYEVGTVTQNTNAYVKAIENPMIDIISHPDDSRIPIDYETIVDAAKENHTLLEINNSSLDSLSSRVGAWQNLHEFPDCSAVSGADNQHVAHMRMHRHRDMRYHFMINKFILFCNHQIAV